MLSAGPAQAASAWKEHAFPDLGIRKDFPNEPKRTKGTYKSPIVPETPADILTSDVDGVVYRMTVVPLKHQNDEGASIMGECSYISMTDATKVYADSPSNFGFGLKGVYGRWTSGDRANGDRIVTACYFNNARLYKIEAVITRRHPSHPNSPMAMRFANSLDFNVDRDDSKSPTNTN